MEAAKSPKTRGQERKMRECSVRLRRCDFEGRGRPAQACTGPGGAPAAPRAIDRVRKYYEAGMLRVKVKADSEGAVVKQELDVDNPRLWRDTTAEPDLYFTEGYSSYLKMEDDTGQTTIKQELDIGATVLQPQAAPALDVLSAELVHGQADPLAPHSSSSGYGATAAPLSRMSARPAPGTYSEKDCCEEYSEVPFSSDCMQHSIEGDNVCQKVSREQSLDRSDTGDMSTDTREFADKRYRRDYHVASAPGGATLMSRVDTCGEGKPYECEHWECSTSYSGKLETQACTHTGNKQYKCGYSASSLSNLKLHQNTHIRKKPYKCEMCEYSASELGTLKKHIRTHTGEKPYKCEVCEYRASQLGTLKKHIRTHTGEKLFKCELCEYSASESNKLKVHMHIHTGEKPYKCDLCVYSASQVSNLKRHMSTHTGEKPYKCGLCGYSASQVGKLKRHMSTHTGGKPYKCEVCEHRASELSELKVHMRIHTGEKPFKCELCGYSASQVGNLKMHKRVHTGEKPYDCKLCEYSASQVSKLRRHMLIHTRTKPYKCELCEYSTSLVSNLKRHTSTHTGAKPYNMTTIKNV